MSDRSMGRGREVYAVNSRGNFDLGVRIPDDGNDGKHRQKK